RPSKPPSDLSGKTTAPVPPTVAESKLAAPLPPPIAKSKPPAPPPPLVVEAKPTFRLLEPTAVALKAGCRKTIVMSFHRENLPNPTGLRIENLPGGISASMVAIPDGRENAEIELSASDTAEQGDKEVAVVALAGTTESRAHFRLTVQPPPRLQ